MWVDADWANDLSNRKSITGFIVTLNRAAISWKSKKQGLVSLSSTEAEYIALSLVTACVIWARGLLNELHFFQRGPTEIMEDNNSTICLSTQRRSMTGPSTSRSSTTTLGTRSEPSIQFLSRWEPRTRLPTYPQRDSVLKLTHTSEMVQVFETVTSLRRSVKYPNVVPTLRPENRRPEKRKSEISQIN